jgi:hypothetical protein
VEWSDHDGIKCLFGLPNLRRGNIDGSCLGRWVEVGQVGRGLTLCRLQVALKGTRVVYLVWTFDASRSCLGLGTCAGSVIRQIVDARALLTATLPQLCWRSPV